MAHRILVTGATGFIGHRLVTTLAAAGGYDIRATTRESHLDLPRAVEIVPDFELTTRRHVRDAVAGMDFVVHLAGRVHITTRIDPIEKDRYDRVNVDGTLGLAREAAKAGVRRFIFISTIAVNGTRTDPGRAFTEDDPALPETPYAHSKCEAEERLVELAAVSGMEVVRIRPPLVYGPGVKANFRAMISWVGQGVPLPFAGVTGNRRTLIGVDNLNDLIRVCLHHPAAANELLLVGDDEDLSTADLLRRLARAMGRPARLFPMPLGLVDRGLRSIGMGRAARRLLQSLRVDSTKARRLLGWRPPVSVDEGLRRAVGGPDAT